MPNSRLSLQSLWQNRHRAALHNPTNWSSSGECKLVYAPTGNGFKDYTEMKSFCSYPDNLSVHIFSGDLQSISCFVDENSGKVFDEFVLNWNQKTSRMAWMLGENDFPLQKYQLTFVVSAQMDPSTGLLRSVRVYWDQASLLLQTGLLTKSLRNLIRADNSEALEGVLAALPISHVGLKPQVGALNNITSLLSELPRSTAGLAVSTPQRPTRSRSLNPALLGVMNFSEESAAFFDSPAPANQRTVKSRAAGLFDNMNGLESAGFKPSLGASETSVQTAQSHIFSESASPTRASKHLPQVNSAQTDKILFESHIFDGVVNDKEGEMLTHNATAPPQCPSHILSPEENLKCEPDHLSKTLSRPGMLGHFHGSSFGEGNYNEEKVKFVPSTAIRFDPNRSQIVMGDGQQDSENIRPKQQQQSSTRKPLYDPNRSQIQLGYDEKDEQVRPAYIRKPSFFD